mmetsp:Transcript_63998/g.126610  ORF Transcript_63998/g.126610 Transcript_63998/m.126610 type:complete len:204 (+) Transcript_63998:933-1544(+)
MPACLKISAASDCLLHSRLWFSLATKVIPERAKRVAKVSSSKISVLDLDVLCPLAEAGVRSSSACVIDVDGLSLDLTEADLLAEDGESRSSNAASTGMVQPGALSEPFPEVQGFGVIAGSASSSLMLSSNASPLVAKLVGVGLSSSHGPEDALTSLDASSASGHLTSDGLFFGELLGRLEDESCWDGGPSKPGNLGFNDDTLG